MATASQNGNLYSMPPSPEPAPGPVPPLPAKPAHTPWWHVILRAFAQAIPVLLCLSLSLPLFRFMEARWIDQSERSIRALYEQKLEEMKARYELQLQLERQLANKADKKAVDDLGKSHSTLQNRFNAFQKQTQDRFSAIEAKISEK